MPPNAVASSVSRHDTHQSDWGFHPSSMDWLEAELALTAPSDMAMSDSFQSHLQQQSSNGSKAASKDELQRLLDLRKDINEATRRNIEMQKVTAEAVKQTRLAKEELQELRNSLTYAAELEAADSATHILQYNATPALPFFPQLLQAVPFLGRQHQESVEFRRLTSSAPWLKRESQRLKQVVLNACKRAAALTLLSENHTDPFGQVEKMTEAELAEFSLPRDDDEAHEEDQAVNWNDVGNKLEREAEDCRTRWLMRDRPGLRNGEAWGQDELIELYSIVEADRAASAPLDWESIAKRLGTERMGVECLMTYARGETNPNNRSTDYTLAEDLEILRLVRIWGHWWAIIGERIGTGRNPQNYQAHHHAEMRPGHRKREIWSQEMDDILLAAVEKEQARQAQLAQQRGHSKEPTTIDQAESSSAPSRRRAASEASRASGEQGTSPSPSHHNDGNEDSNNDDEDEEEDGQRAAPTAIKVAIERMACTLDWVRISADVPNQSPLLCRRRWIILERKAEPAREKQRKQEHEEKLLQMEKVPWTKEEDAMLLEGSRKEGWVKMAERIGGRRHWRHVMKRYWVVANLGVGAPSFDTQGGISKTRPKKRPPPPPPVRKSRRVAGMSRGEASEQRDEEPQNDGQEGQAQDGTPMGVDGPEG